MMTKPIIYKEFYNKGRGIPEPEWGTKLNLVQCSTCGSRDVYASAHPDDPEEIFGNETIRCGHCGHITDWYEARKQLLYHPTSVPRRVVRESRR